MQSIDYEDDVTSRMRYWKVETAAVVGGAIADNVSNPSQLPPSKDCLNAAGVGAL